MENIGVQLETIMEGVRAVFIDKNRAREQALPLCRDAIRNSANGIRAVHRQDFAQARELIDTAGRLVGEAREALRDHDPGIVEVRVEEIAD